MKPGQALDHGEQIALLLDRIAAKEEALKELVKERKGEIAALRKRVRALCDLQLGRGQLDLEEEANAAAAGALADARKGDKP